MVLEMFVPYTDAQSGADHFALSNGESMVFSIVGTIIDGALSDEQAVFETK